MVKNIVYLVVLVLISLIYTRPYFRSGFFATHDGEWAIVRLAEMQREVKDLQIPPRWSDYLNHGFGYPLFNFSYPFPYYLGIVLKYIGFGFTDSVKILFAGSVFLSAVLMYLLGKSIGGRQAGFIAAVFYTVAPYRMVDLYVRGSLGESLSLALFPMLFFVSLKYIIKPSLILAGITSSVLAILILTHNVTAIIFFPIWILFFLTMVISYSENLRIYIIRYLLPVVLLGLSLPAYFFIPAIAEKKLVFLSVAELANLETNFVNISEFLTSAWSYGIRPSFRIGILHIAAIFVSLIVIVFFASNITKKKYYPVVIFSSIISLILIYLMTRFSLIFWEIPPLSWLDFPWRIMTPLIFILSLLVIFISLNKVTRILGIIMGFAVVVTNLSYAAPSQYFQKPDDYYTTNDATTTSMDEYTPVWVYDKPSNRYSSKVELVSGQSAVSGLNYNSKLIRFSIDSRTDSIVKINTIYYPGWKLTIDGRNQTIDYFNPSGVMQFSVTPGNHLIKAEFKETPVRLIADLISLAGLFCTAILFSLGISNKIKRSDS